jgi:hypothetical protein
MKNGQEGRAAREVLKLRRQISREEYEAYQNEDRVDMLTRWRNDEEEGSHYWQALNAELENEIRSRELARETSEIASQSRASAGKYLRRAALEQGPTPWQNFWWGIRKKVQSVQKKLGPMSELLWILAALAPAYLYLLALVYVVHIVFFAASTWLVANFVLMAVIGAIVIGVNLVIVDATGEHDHLLCWLGIVVLAGMLGFNNFKCVGPTAPYEVLMVKDAQGKIIRLEQYTNNSFINSPRVWRGESVKWFDLRALGENKQTASEDGSRTLKYFYKVRLKPGVLYSGKEFQQEDRDAIDAQILKKVKETLASGSPKDSIEATSLAAQIGAVQNWAYRVEKPIIEQLTTTQVVKFGEEKVEK